MDCIVGVGGRCYPGKIVSLEEIAKALGVSPAELRVRGRNIYRPVQGTSFPDDGDRTVGVLLEDASQNQIDMPD